MEEPPPSYSAAIAKDPLPLIAPYIEKRDLYSVSLVCRSWHREFSEYLWQRPEVFWNLGDRSALSNPSLPPSPLHIIYEANFYQSTFHPLPHHHSPKPLTSRHNAPKPTHRDTNIIHHLSKTLATNAPPAVAALALTRLELVATARSRRLLRCLALVKST